MTLDEMKKVDIRTVDPATLHDRRDVRIDSRQPKEKRIASYNRQPVLRADQVGELTDCPVASDEVRKLPCAVKRRRVPVDMIVDMRFVRMGAYDKSVIAL